MARLKKLEEEMARTSDPKVRQQLQDLIGMRRIRRKETVNLISGIFSSLLSDNRTEEEKNRDLSMSIICIFFLFCLIIGAIGIFIYVDKYGWTMVGWLATVLYVLKWIIWGLAGLLSVRLFIQFARWQLEHEEFGQLSKLMSSVAIIIMLIITILTSHSPFHLLWFVPVVLILSPWLLNEQ